MHGSIARHHVHYRVGSRSPAAAALLPAIDRAIQQALASAIERRLEHALGDAGEVIVIREATADVVLQARDCALSSAIVDRVSKSAADAVVSIVASPAGADAVMRFASETAFVGSFIAEVLAGTAHARWFFSPLHQYARDTPAETIAAVLADHDAGEILRWLKEHGHELPAGALRPGTDVLPGDRVTNPRTAATRDIAPLASAALQILSAIGWDVHPASWPELCARFAAANPAAPDWRDARSLTSWVIALIGFVATATAEVRSRRRIDPAAAESLLQDTLDWLDVPLVRTALASVAEQSHDVEPMSPEMAALPAADARSSAIIDRVVALIAEQVRGGSWARPPASANEVARSLVASIAEPDRGGAIADVALMARIESIVAACVTLFAERMRRVMPAPPPRSGPSSTPAPQPVSAEVREAIATLTEAGPAATPLLRHLAGPAADAAAGELTPWGGLFLLTRPVMDVKLPMLARDAGIPLGSVLSIVARTLLSADPPFDGPTRFWIGSSERDVMECALDDERLDSLRVGLEDLLFDQHLRAASIPDDAAHPRFVTLLVRAWARWLPAMHDASVAFLVRNCLSRAGRVRVTDAAVDVALDAAPLDVVLDMAGCFRPIDTVGWLGGRRMTFVVT